MGTLHKQFTEIYYKALNDFCNKIEESYEKKKEIIIFCESIKNKLSYTAPEIQNITYRERILYMANQYLPKEHNNWSQDGWNILIQAYEDGYQLYLKNYNE